MEPRIPLPRLVFSGLVATLLAVGAIALVRYVALYVIAVDPGFAPLQGWSAPLYTAIAGVGATAVYALLARYSERPTHRFLLVSTVVLLLSFLPDLALLIANGPFPGTNAMTVGILSLMHFIAAGIIVGGLLWGVHAQNPLKIRYARVAT